MNDSGIKKYSTSDLELMAREESRTDLARLRQLTETDLEESIARDPDWSNIPEDWHQKAEAVMPVPKKLFSLRLDADVIDWFRAEGTGYQTKMNAVLRSFMEHEAARRRS